jgi:nucleoside-diphosphate-sugar epimerase
MQNVVELFSEMKRQRILITGAAGRIGSLLARHWQEHHELVLTDRREPGGDVPGEFRVADLSDWEAMRPMFDDIDTVVHLAADPSPNASWQSILPNNVVSTYHVLEASAAAGCHRVILASSVNAVMGYEADVQVKTSMPVAPANLYGVSKAFAEATGRYYADQRKLSVHCLRLGAVLEKDDKRLVPGHALLDVVLSQADLLKLYDASLSADNVPFGIFHGTSDNRFKRLDLSDTKAVLHYDPSDDAFVMAGMVSPGRPDHLFENR